MCYRVFVMRPRKEVPWMVRMTALVWFCSLPTVVYLSKPLWLVSASPKSLSVAKLIGWSLMIDLYWDVTEGTGGIRLPDLQEQSPNLWAMERHYSSRSYRGNLGVGENDKCTHLQDTVHRCVRTTVPSVSTGGAFFLHRNCAVKVIFIFESGRLQIIIDARKECRF